MNIKIMKETARIYKSCLEKYGRENKKKLYLKKRDKKIIVSVPLPQAFVSDEWEQIYH